MLTIYSISYTVYKVDWEFGPDWVSVFYNHYKGPFFYSAYNWIMV